MRARQHREAERVGVLLDDGRDDLLGRLVQARVDDLEARVAQRPGDHLRAPVVAVEARFADDDAVGAVHGAEHRAGAPDSPRRGARGAQVASSHRAGPRGRRPRSAEARAPSMTSPARRAAARDAARQWVKNLLVVVAPVAAGKFFHGHVSSRTAVAFLAFCLASSGTYLLNDVARRRGGPAPPRASGPDRSPRGWSPSRSRVATACVLLVAGLGIALRADLAPRARRRPVRRRVGALLDGRASGCSVIELGFVTSGFVLRAIAGGVATGLPLSLVVPRRHLVRRPVRGRRQAARRVPRARRGPRRPPSGARRLHDGVPRVRAHHVRRRHGHRLLPLGVRGRPQRPWRPPRPAVDPALGGPGRARRALRAAAARRGARRGARGPRAARPRPSRPSAWPGPCSSPSGSTRDDAHRLGPDPAVGRDASSRRRPRTTSPPSSREATGRVIARGLGRSYGDAAQVAGGTVHRQPRARRRRARSTRRRRGHARGGRVDRRRSSPTPCRRAGSCRSRPAPGR